MASVAEPLTITLPPLHDLQREVAKHPARYKVIAAGRRWGKSMLSMAVSLKSALEGGRIWVVAPSYKQTLENWAYLQRLITQMPAGLAKARVSELTVSFSSGGSIQMRTGDNPDNLRGSGLDGVVLDEAATIKADVWDLVLRPALADKQGWAMFISSPAHYNHFFDWFQRGQDTEQSDWASWQFPTWTNPYIAQAEIDAAQRDMDPQDFDQEFGASFTAVGGAIFPLLAQNRPYYLRPMPHGTVDQMRRKGVGMDWGTTRQHQSSVVGGGILSTGAVWITSSWLSDTGSSNDWNDEALRVKRGIGATFARVDRSQASNLDPLKALGFEADKGLADVEARIGIMQGLVRAKAIFFDSNDPGVRELYTHLCEYHRIPEGQPKAGQPEEVHDDDVDAAHYLVAELVQPSYAMPSRMANRQAQRRPQTTGWLGTR